MSDADPNFIKQCQEIMAQDYFCKTFRNHDKKLHRWIPTTPIKILDPPNPETGVFLMGMYNPSFANSGQTQLEGIKFDMRHKDVVGPLFEVKACFGVSKATEYNNSGLRFWFSTSKY